MIPVISKKYKKVIPTNITKEVNKKNLMSGLHNLTFLTMLHDAEDYCSKSILYTTALDIPN